MKSPSLIGRLMFSVTAAVVTFWVVAAVGGIFVMSDEFAEIFDSALQETAERLTPLIVDDLVRRDNPETTLSLDVGPQSSARQYLTYQARDIGGNILVHSSDITNGPFPAPLTEGFWEDDTARYYTVATANNTIFVQVADQLKNRREAINEGALALLLPILVLVPLSLYVIRLVARRAVHPVNDLRQAIAEKDSGDLTPITVQGLASELQPIVHSVNFLMGRVRSTLEAERAFTSNSAHELRTPIAGALAHTQLLKSEVKTATGQARVEQVEASLHKLSRLVEKLMQLARAEANITFSDKPVELLKVLDFLVEEFQRAQLTVHYEGRIDYKRDLKASLWRPINEDAFAIVTRNLIENALLHGAHNEPVIIRVVSNNTIRIINGCKRLSSEDIARVQKRFGRGATASPGSGLGLPIAIEIANQMHAELRFSSPAKGREDGFEVELCFLPLNRDSGATV